MKPIMLHWLWIDGCFPRHDPVIKWPFALTLDKKSACVFKSEQHAEFHRFRSFTETDGLALSRKDFTGLPSRIPRCFHLARWSRSLLALMVASDHLKQSRQRQTVCCDLVMPYQEAGHADSVTATIAWSRGVFIGGYFIQAGASFSRRPRGTAVREFSPAVSYVLGKHAEDERTRADSHAAVSM